MTDEERRVPAPQFVNGREVCAMVRLVTGDGEAPNQWGVICRESTDRSGVAETFIVWRVAYMGDYTTVNGQYDMPWGRALKVFADRFGPFTGK
jgi:hypothetical protein